MAKQNAINLDVTPSINGYTIGGGTITTSSLTVSGTSVTLVGGGTNLTISGSDITLIGGGNTQVEFTFPVSSSILAGLSISQSWTNTQSFNAPIFISPSLTLTGSEPASVSSSGSPGTLVFSSGRLYICTGSNAWAYVSLSMF